MDVCLLFPSFIPEQKYSPYPSLPYLARYFSDHSAHSVYCYDFNADLIDKLCPEYIQQVPQDEDNFPSMVIERFAHKVGIEVPKHVLQGDEFREEAHYLLDCWNLTYNQLTTLITSDEEDDWITLCGTEFMDFLKSRDGVLIGFSVTYISQFGAAIRLAKRIKNTVNNAFIVFGGTAVNRVRSNIGKIPLIFDLVDCFVPGHGEKVLLNLANCLDSSGDWHKLAGVIYRNSEREVISNESVVLDPNLVGVPDYGSLLRNHRYYSPSVLCLRTNTGCYWGKCHFCAQTYCGYYQRRPELIADDMIHLVDQFGATYVCFVDTATPFPIMSRIADSLIERKREIPWEAMVRFDCKLDESIFSRLKESGCRKLNFGLESGSQRVNDLINKGIDLERAEKVLGYCAKYSISFAILAMIGFPGETEQEMLETVDFINKNRPLGGKDFSAWVSIFALNADSYVHLNPEEFGISIIDKDNQDYFYRNALSYECKNKVPHERMLEIVSPVNEFVGDLTSYSEHCVPKAK